MGGEISTRSNELSPFFFSDFLVTRQTAEEYPPDPRMPGAYFIKELRLAERAHWSLPWKRVATIDAHVLQFAILQVAILL